MIERGSDEHKKCFGLLLGVVSLGVGVGVIVIVIAGLGGGDDAETDDATVQSAPGNLADLALQMESGDFNPEDLAALQEEAQGLFGQRGGFGFPGGRALLGTVSQVEGELVTVDTFQGSSQARVGADAFIGKTDQGSLADLTPGTQIAVVGERGEDGVLSALSIVITPEDSEGMAGRMFGGGFGQGLGQFGAPSDLPSPLGTQEPFSGTVTPAMPDGAPQFGQGGLGQQFGGGQGSGAAALVGAVESIDGNVVTVITPQGPLAATVDDNTIIQKPGQGSLDDLQEGIGVSVFGQPDWDGIVQAEFVIIIPELPEGFPDFGLPGIGIDGIPGQSAP